jgi:hypothetical protein
MIRSKQKIVDVISKPLLDPAMKKQCPLALLVFVLGLFSTWAVSEQPPTDSEIRKKIVGTWLVDTKISETRSMSGTATFSADGTTSATVILILEDKKQTIQTEGKWEVKDGVLIETIIKSNSKFPPVGYVTRDRITRINDDEYVYISEKGKTVTIKRSKASKR